MKKILIFLIVMFILTTNVYAVNSTDSVGSDLIPYQCTAFQDDKMTISGDVYFGRCMQAECNGTNWEVSFYSVNSVSCKNGNLNPYTNKTKDGCSNYTNRSCSREQKNSIKYCTTITYFDCSRTSNGSKYEKPTTTTKKPYTKITTTTTQAPTTVPAKNNNTYLKSLNLSSGTFTFNKETREYNIDVASNISFITVKAEPEVETSVVNVSGNTNLKSGKNVITIKVTAEDGSEGTYLVNVNKAETLSNNAKMSAIRINGETLPGFSSTIYNYTYRTKNKSLDVQGETEDSNAIYMVNGADNISDGSVIKIVVTAADDKTMQEYTITIDVPSSSVGLITIIFIIILAIVIGGGTFYFYTKKKNSTEKEYEYE